MEVLRTTDFQSWIDGLRDRKGAARILSRIDRIAMTGNLGDAKRIEGLLEVRCDFGPGYRLYATQRGPVLIVLLCGGDKSSQQRDIAKARELAADLA